MVNFYHQIKQIINIYNQKKIKKEESGAEKYNTTPNLTKIMSTTHKHKPINHHSKNFDKVMPSYYSYPNLVENEEQVGHDNNQLFSNSISISLVLGMTFVIGRFIYRQWMNK